MCSACCLHFFFWQSWLFFCQMDTNISFTLTTVNYFRCTSITIRTTLKFIHTSRRNSGNCTAFWETYYYANHFDSRNRKGHEWFVSDRKTRLSKRLGCHSFFIVYSLSAATLILRFLFCFTFFSFLCSPLRGNHSLKYTIFHQHFRKSAHTFEFSKSFRSLWKRPALGITKLMHCLRAIHPRTKMRYEI